MSDQEQIRALWTEIRQLQRGIEKLSTSLEVDPTIGCRVYNNTTTSLPHNTLVVVNFNAERYDTYNMHDNSTNPQYISFSFPGIYNIGGQLCYQANGVGQRYLRVYHWRSSVQRLIVNDLRNNAGSGWQTYINASANFYCEAGDLAWLAALLRQTNRIFGQP